MLSSFSDCSKWQIECTEMENVCAKWKNEKWESLRRLKHVGGYVDVYDIFSYKYWHNGKDNSPISSRWAIKHDHLEGKDEGFMGTGKSFVYFCFFFLISTFSCRHSFMNVKNTNSFHVHPRHRPSFSFRYNFNCIWTIYRM